MDPRLDFSDLVQYSDVPDLTTGTQFANPIFAPVDLTPEEEFPVDDVMALDDIVLTATVPLFATRCLAKLIDGAVAGTLYVFITLFFSDWFTGFFLGGLAASAYFLFSDGLPLDFMRHRSLGKRMMNMTVERVDEEPVTLLTSIKRNWMFTIGFFAQAFTFTASPVTYLLALVAIGLIGYELYWLATNPNGVRWGDDLAGTDVMHPAPILPATKQTEVLDLTPDSTL